MSDVPEEVVADILSRLPVEPLLRFRCVSKPWSALIDSPHFIKLHLNRSIETNSNCSIILKSDFICSVDFDSPDNAIKLNDPMRCNTYRVTVVGSCNGLFCLHEHVDDCYVLWNPSTRKHQILPCAEIQFPLVKVHHTFDFYGFGYDCVNDDYKLVRITQIFEKHNLALCGSEVKVYSTKSNSWRVLGDFPYDFAIVQEQGELASGALHWMMSKEPQPDMRSVITAFDLATEKYWLVPQPEYSDKGFFKSVGVLGGCLCVLCNFRNGKDDIWVMKSYGVKESWTKLISVAQPSGIMFFDFVRPLAYSKSGDQVLLQQHNARLIWYDLKRETVTNVMVHGMPKHFVSNVCFGSLVQLSGRGGSVRRWLAIQKRKNKKKRSTKTKF